MTTVAPMARFTFRNVALLTSAAALICFCSCERHTAGELPVHEEHASSNAADRAHADGTTEKQGPGPEHGDMQSRATTAMSVTPPPGSPSPTAVNFFPTASPH